MRDIVVATDGIRLGQFLKLAGLADTGADARTLVAVGEVEVNGQPEHRRGRQLHIGDIVAAAGEAARVVGPAGA